MADEFVVFNTTNENKFCLTDSSSSIRYDILTSEMVN